MIWPENNMPFHQGEVQLQKMAGVHEQVMSYAPKFIRSYLPDQHREFYQNQPALILAARDQHGSMWATTVVMANQENRSLVTSPDPYTLEWNDPFVSTDDALYESLLVSTHHSQLDVGILGIEFATARRNRVNGKLLRRREGKLSFNVQQSFGNCPQYIAPRTWWWWSEATDGPHDSMVQHASNKKKTTFLSTHQMEQIRKATTVFIATGFSDNPDDARQGNDVSHRGGPPGFLIVQDANTVILPDFHGNNHFNSLGNLIMDDRMGITIPNFTTGGLLQMSGRGAVDLDSTRAAKIYNGAERLITFHIEQVNVVPDGSLPIRWSDNVHEQESKIATVRAIVAESVDVKSFYLKLEPGTCQAPPRAGQHLPVILHDGAKIYSRKYSISGYYPDQHEIRISVKRQGKASNFLHDAVKEGDSIRIQSPAGDFILQDGKEITEKPTETPTRPIVLLSAGIGLTPVLSMLQSLVKSQRTTSVYWIHGTRNGKLHAMQNEVHDLMYQANQQSNGSSRRFASLIFYSQPTTEDVLINPLGNTSQSGYHKRGRVNVAAIQAFVPDWKEAEYYMCGPSAFLADLQIGLEAAGVSNTSIHFESF